MDDHAPVSARGPGRLDLIGEHTDYSRGLCLPVALNRGVTVTARPLKGNKVDALALDLRERDSFSLDGIDGAEGWRAFVRGTVAELRAAGFEVRAAELQISGDLPHGSGLDQLAAFFCRDGHAAAHRHGEHGPGGGGFGGSVMGIFAPEATPPSRATTVVPAGAAHLLRTES